MPIDYMWISDAHVYLKTSCFCFLQTDGQLFYTGPNRQYMRLVVQSDAQREAVLQECHIDAASGRHNGVRSTRNTVVSTYYWSTITEDVSNWVKPISWDFAESDRLCAVLFL